MSKKECLAHIYFLKKKVFSKDIVYTYLFNLHVLRKQGLRKKNNFNPPDKLN